MIDVGQWNTVETPEIDSHSHSQLIFDEVVKAINGEKINLATNSAEKIYTTICPSSLT